MALSPPTTDCSRIRNRPKSIVVESCSVGEWASAPYCLFPFEEKIITAFNWYTSEQKSFFRAHQCEGYSTAERVGLAENMLPAKPHAPPTTSFLWFSLVCLDSRPHSELRLKCDGVNESARGAGHNEVTCVFLRLYLPVLRRTIRGCSALEQAGPVRVREKAALIMLGARHPSDPRLPFHIEREWIYAAAPTEARPATTHLECGR